MRQTRILLLLLLLVTVFAAVWFLVWSPDANDPNAEPWYLTFAWDRYAKQAVVVPDGPYKGKRLKYAIRNKLEGALAAYNFPQDFAKHLPRAYLRAFQKVVTCPMLAGRSDKFARKLQASLAKPKYGLTSAQQRARWHGTIIWLKRLKARTIESFLKGRTYFKYKFNKPDHPGQCAYSYRRATHRKQLVSHIRLRKRSFRGKRGLCGLRFLDSTLFHEMLHTSWAKEKPCPPIPQCSVMFRLKQWHKGNPKASKKAAQLTLAKFNGSLEEALVGQLEKACLNY